MKDCLLVKNTRLKRLLKTGVKFPALAASPYTPKRCIRNASLVHCSLRGSQEA